MEQAQRLKTLMAALKTTQSRFSDKIGVKAAQTSQILNGIANLSSGYVNKILMAYPNVNSNWLFTGSGEMFVPSKSSSVLAEPGAPYKSKIYLPNIDEMEIKRTLSANLNTLISRWRLKKNEFFQLVIPGISKQTVTTYLNGQSALPLPALIKVEMITGITISRWLTDTIPPDEMPTEPQSGGSRGVDVLKELRNLLRRADG